MVLGDGLPSGEPSALHGVHDDAVADFDVATDERLAQWTVRSGHQFVINRDSEMERAKMGLKAVHTFYGSETQD